MKLLNQKINFINQIIKEEIEKQIDYRGSHQAPDKSGGAPLYDLSSVYPEDIYSNLGARYYGHSSGGDSMDNETINIIQRLRNKPNALVRIYRAIPKTLTREEEIDNLTSQKRYILKYDKLPKNIKTSLSNTSAYYDHIHDQIEKKLLNNNDEKETEKIKINSGDWVTINKRYAIEHGKSSLNNKYRILTKVVKASELYTDGNSIHEWGWSL